MFCCIGGWYSLSSSCSAFRSFSRLRRFLGVLSKPRLTHFSLTSLSVTTQWFAFLFSRANHFFFFRIAWVKCNSNNLGRLLRRRGPPSVAEILSSFLWAVVHGFIVGVVCSSDCGYMEKFSWSFMSNGSRNLLVVVETIFPFTFLSYSFSLLVVFPVPSRQFRLTAAWSQCWVSRTIVITSQLDICSGCISFLSGLLVFLSQFL